jgi:catechol 2,3-dioxygenase
VGQQAPSPIPTAVGLYHVAIQLADWEAVRAAHAILVERGLLRGAVDHGVSRSLYTADPDGNEIELYRDAPRSEWEGRIDEVMTVKPLVID